MVSSGYILSKGGSDILTRSEGEEREGGIGRGRGGIEGGGERGRDR